MDWSNWLSLGLGLGLGVSANWLWRQLVGRRNQTLEGHQDNPTLNQNYAATVRETDQDVPTLLAQLKQAQLASQLAGEISQFQAGFLARTAHELRSPLNSLIGLHQLILSDLCDDPAEEREFVAQAHNAALQLMHLLDEVLAVARTAKGSKKLEIQPLQLATVLQSVYQSLHLIAANRNLQLQLLLPDSDLYVLADPYWLQQILVNLVDTCIAQMAEGKVLLSVQTNLATETAQITIDTPLAASVWSELMDLLQLDSQHQPASKTANLSPGMKLLLHQTLLELMQGQLELLSVPGELTNLTRLQVTIPLVIPEAEFLEPEAN